MTGKNQQHMVFSTHYWFVVRVVFTAISAQLTYIMPFSNDSKVKRLILMIVVKILHFWEYNVRKLS